MVRGIRIYLCVLLVAIVGWGFLKAQNLPGFGQGQQWCVLLGIVAIYLCSHLFRMLRLALLTLDERSKILPLIGAHALTAFPNSVLPFKIGEVLRLAAFARVYDGRQKAWAVWLAERLGDVIVISTFIVALYLFNVNVPSAMRAILVVFVVAAGAVLFALFAIAKVFVYLNRHLVLTSVTRRGLSLLRASHALRSLERDIARSVEGRLSGLLLLSVLIWAFEILALSLFIRYLHSANVQFATLFVSGLLASLPGGPDGGTSSFGLYQSTAIAAFTVLFLILFWMVPRLNPGKP